MEVSSTRYTEREMSGALLVMKARKLKYRELRDRLPPGVTLSEVEKAKAEFETSLAHCELLTELQQASLFQVFGDNFLNMEVIAAPVFCFTTVAQTFRLRLVPADANRARQIGRLTLNHVILSYPFHTGQVVVSVFSPSGHLLLSDTGLHPLLYTEPRQDPRLATGPHRVAPPTPRAIPPEYLLEGGLRPAAGDRAAKAEPKQRFQWVLVNGRYGKMFSDGRSDSVESAAS